MLHNYWRVDLYSQLILDAGHYVKYYLSPIDPTKTIITPTMIGDFAYSQFKSYPSEKLEYFCYNKYHEQILNIYRKYESSVEYKEINKELLELFVSDFVLDV
jgi:hypothetical protein